MVALPVTLGGGVIAAYLTGGLLTLGSFVGFLAVLAIAARNTVALVDRLRSLERLGTAPGPSLVLRGTRERLGPIVMTALAMGLACVPILVLGDRPGLELLRPMAVVLMGGLITSTLMSLFFFPTLYLDLTARRAAGTVDVTLPNATEPQPAGVQ